MWPNKSYRCEDLIDWNEDKHHQFKGVLPQPTHCAFSEAVLQKCPETIICKTFCGRECKYENGDWNEKDMAIKGLYSHWITRKILAMARPNTKNINEYGMIEQFKKNRINTIINLQMLGEHAYCCHGLEPEGFSYNLEEMMKHGISVYNYGWDDFGMGTLESILDAVKVMQFALSEGKVAVHCHAGQGRTTLLIACYLVYMNRMDPSEVVHYIRSRRPGSLSMNTQILCIREFADYLRNCQLVFFRNNNSDSTVHEITLADFLFRQKILIHGKDFKMFRHVPMIIYECCQRLLILARRGDQCGELIKATLSETHHSLCNNNRLSSSRRNPELRKSVTLERFTTLNPQTKMFRLNCKFGYSSSKPSTAYLPEPTCQPATVAHAMAITEYENETIDKVESLKNAITDDPNGYETLQQETNPEVIAKLMWDWLDQLQQPVLISQDLPSMLQYCDDPVEGLRLLSKGARHTVEMIFRTVAILETLDEHLERSVVQRVLSTLTQQNMVVELDALVTSDTILLRRTSHDTGIMRSTVATKMLYFFMHLLSIMQMKIRKSKENNS